jgi:hypothetical protein
MFGRAPESGKSARCDAVHEYRPDDSMGRYSTNHRPPRPVPYVYDADERAGFM